MSNEEMHEIIKKAYEKGIIHNIKEAFDEFPPKEEWHKGDVCNVIKESTVYYGSSYKVGDIVFVKDYEYSDGYKGHNHLFVIVLQDNIAVPIENFGMLISSNLKKLKFKQNILLERDDINNLAKDSVVKTDVMYKIDNKDILFKIGTVDNGRIKEYLKSYNLL